MGQKRTLRRKINLQSVETARRKVVERLVKNPRLYKNKAQARRGE